MLGSREILRFMNEHLGENISEGSYDDIRRKHLEFLVEATIVSKAAKNPAANKNDGTRKYAIDSVYVTELRKYGTKEWDKAVPGLIKERGSLSKKLKRERELALLPVEISTGEVLRFGPGAHNLLQKAIISEFLPRFGFDAEVLYVGDADNKMLHVDPDRLEELGLSQLLDEKIPDVIACSRRKEWVYFIEAVTTANPISEIRLLALKELASACKFGLVFVTAFPDRATFRKHVKDLAWETEVWIADSPDHLIHFNGDRFLGPH